MEQLKEKLASAIRVRVPYVAAIAFAIDTFHQVRGWRARSWVPTHSALCELFHAFRRSRPLSPYCARL